MQENKNGRSHLPPSESAYRRRVLAEERRAYLPDVHEIIRSKEAAGRRLEEVEKKLEENDGLPVEERAKLEVEEIWLQFRLGEIGDPERQSRLQLLLNRLEAEHPDVLERLTAEDKDHRTILSQIVKRVMPPTTETSYHTKRGRF